MEREELRKICAIYSYLRDAQNSAYDRYARINNMSVRELHVLSLIYYAPNGCLQSYLCTRLAASKQTISAIVKKLETKGIVQLDTFKGDHRGKVASLTRKGREKADKIIPPLHEAELAAMSTLSDEEMQELIRISKTYTDMLRIRIGNILMETRPFDMEFGF